MGTLYGNFTMLVTKTQSNDFLSYNAIKKIKIKKVFITNLLKKKFTMFTQALKAEYIPLKAVKTEGKSCQK